jgi:hypothetical protein
MSSCKICSKELYSGNRSGYCRGCWNQSPEKREKTSAAMKRNWHVNPVMREKYKAAGIRNLNTPGTREKALATIKERKTWEIAKQYIDEEARKRGIRRNAERVLGHIPREYRDQYRHLTRVKRFTAAEASEMVERMWEADMKRFRRKLMEAK